MKLKALGISVAVALVGLALFVVAVVRVRNEAAGGAPVPVVVVTQDVPLGTLITEQMLGVRTLPEAYVESRQIDAAEARTLIGLRTVTSVRAGETLLWSDLDQALEGGTALSGLVGSGMRAITITVGAGSAFDGLLRSGDRVDVLHTVERDDGTHVTAPLLQNAIVLAVGGTMARQGVETEGATSAGYGAANRVAIAVSIEQAQTLLHARELGELNLALRHPDDVAVLEGVPTTTDADVLGIRARAEAAAQRRTGTEVAALPARIDTAR